MYFKQIELAGFKSFADRTTIALDAGITAIVGPNGCGKSNILDALRWSLGEQSAKALRGSHMQDVIFNGSEHRPASGMAEVILTFDNADNALPIDFAEVTIGRRVYRSGESEYFINKAPCRLRDIHELFMDTGIGTNAYSLIGQGKIDMVLSSKPEDRRFLFEEAAGIIKYKTRKRVAMRKLESADQNLLRLNDIIAEVDRQMRSLKRQVSAAIRHRELTEELRGLEIRNAWLHYNELSGQIADWKDRFGEARDAYEKASSETARLEADLEALNLKRVELERALMARKDGEYQIESEMEKIESQIALLRRDIAFAREQAATAAQEAESLLQRAAAARMAEQAAADRIAALRADADRAQGSLGEEQRAYNQAQEAVTRAEAGVEQVRARILERTAVRSKTESELESIGVNLSSLDGQLQWIFEQQQSHHSRQEELAQKLQEAQRRHAEAQEKLRATEEQRQQELQARQAASARLEALNQEWAGVREERSSREARLRSLRELRDSYEGFAAGVRAVMQAKQSQQRFPGLIGPAADVIRAAREHERAIEAALGGNVNNVVVETAEDAKAAIQFLKETGAGRVTFLPLDTLRPGAQDDADALKGLPGIIGRAIDFVQYEARLRPAVEYLLHNTVLVETIDDALRIARAERRIPRLVTRDGEVVLPAGAVTGGRTKNEGRGLLGRSAEIDELERGLAEVQARVEALARDAAETGQAVQRHADAARRLEGEEAQLRRAAGELGVEVARISAELHGLQQAAEGLASQRDTLARERETLASKHGETQEKFSSLASDDAQLQQELSAAQEAAAHARAALEAAAARLGDLRVAAVERSRELEEAERNRAREAEEAERCERLAAERREQNATLEQKAIELETRIADLVERSKALSETKEEAHAKVLEAQREQQGVIDQSDALSGQLKKLRAQVDEAQKAVHRAELELSQKEGQVRAYVERIAEAYGLALASLDEKDVGTDDYDETERARLIGEHKKALQRLGTVNLMAIEEYEALEQRAKFLKTQEEDLRSAKETLLDVVKRIDVTIVQMFLDTFNTVAEQFKDYFRRLFNGGQARIYLLNEEDPLECGIEIEARPPGKKPQVISLLSGGEQAMTAIALLFSIFSAKPSPFCVLDEVDAPLDDANIGRFLSLVDEFVDRSQFIIITHNKQTMSHADALFGVTQQERGVSQLVAVKFDEVAV
jgi:chromosome segregation protein